MKARTAIRVCIVMALLITLLAGASAGVAFHVQNNWPYIAMGVGTGVITFFGLLILGHNGEERWKITGESMRTAIAGAVVVEYLALVGTVAFFVQGQMPPIAQTMITNFTTIVGVVIAFYFGASAFVQVEREKHAKSNDKPGNAAAIVPK